MELLTRTMVTSDTASTYANTQNDRLQSTVGYNPRRYQQYLKEKYFLSRNRVDRL